MLAGIPVEVVDSCVYLGNCINVEGLILKETYSRIGKASAAFPIRGTVMLAYHTHKYASTALKRLHYAVLF